ncbi:phosphatase PAP2-related protein [Hymenobacter norwichensis]|uniref:phosphatase PAP2-related protein n=1 Tax=Hymenobacter norwichensis TaxID=223903 RepID=UPI0003B3A5E4|nr:phosphatase PAP2-related protein [Hymenobacter norwichensis]
MPHPVSAPNTPSAIWPAAWRLPAFRYRLLLTLALLIGLVASLPHFFAWIQARPGTPLPDPLLTLLPVHDVSWFIFIIIYLSVGATLAYVLPRPYVLLRLLAAYWLMHMSRVILLSLLPLEPPIGLLPLRDPIIDTFIYVAAGPITKDLFFSGHTATVMLLALATKGTRRWWLLAATAAVGLLVLVQHVHYTYDVLAAPVFALGCYWLAGFWARFEKSA